MPRGINDYDSRELQGRNSANANSVAVISPGLITDEMVFLFDAGNYASCPASATQWSDLVNGWRSTANGTPTYSLDGGGSVVYTAASVQYTTINQLPSGTSFRLLPLNGISLIAWVKRSGSITDFSGIIFDRASSATGLIVVTNRAAYSWNNTSGSYNWNSGLSIPDGAWCYIGLSVFDDRAILTTGTSTGFNVATNPITHATVSAATFVIGSDTAASSRVWNGNIAVAGLYNRGLSQDELQQNFNATRARFGV